MKMKNFLAILLVCFAANTALPIPIVSARFATKTVSLTIDVTPPTLSSTTISTNGTTVTLVFSEAVTRGAGYSTGNFDTDGLASNNTLTYVSGDGSNTWVMTATTTILSTGSGDTPNIDFSGTANSVEDASGNDLAAIVDGSVTNISTQTGTITVIDDQSGGDSNPITGAVTSDGTAHWDTPGARAVTLKRQTNLVSGTSVGLGLSRISDVAFSANQTAGIKMNFSGGPNSGPAVGIQSSTNASCYVGYVNSGTEVIITKWTDNGTSIGTATLQSVTVATLTTSNFVQLKRVVTGGNAVLTVQVDGVDQSPSYTDSSSPYLAGQPGMHNDGNGGKITSFKATTP